MINEETIDWYPLDMNEWCHMFEGARVGLKALTWEDDIVCTQSSLLYLHDLSELDPRSL